MRTKVKTRIFYAILLSCLLAGFLQGCKHCNHELTYNKTSNYQIQYTYGSHKEYENIYEYKLKDGVVEIKKGKVCFWCGEVIGFEYEIIAGSYKIIEHRYSR